MYVLVEFYVALGFEFTLLKHEAWKGDNLFFFPNAKRYFLIAKCV
jgi:hypothetical protein